ncbi:MAG: ACT domain-containing protein [Spirochaetota bacterium]
MNRIIITMTVKNHPGVMSHIAGLFSRRAVNIDEIAVMQTGTNESRMLLLVENNIRSMTITRQLEQHYDIAEISWRDFEGKSLFERECALQKI